MNIDELRLPPHNTEAEQAVLSAILTDNRLINDLDWLREDDFYQLENKSIYRRMSAMSMQGIPIDPLTLINALEGSQELTGVLDHEYIVNLAVGSRGGSNIKHYAGLIRDKSMARKLVQIGNAITEAAYSAKPVPEKIDLAQSLVMGLVSGGSREPRSIDVILRDVVTDLDRRANIKGGIVGQRTGFIDVDKLTGGFQPGQLVVVAGRPGSGKTTFAMNICENVIQDGKNVIVFNLEMIDVNLAMKTMSSLGRVPYEKMRSGDIGDYGANVNAAAIKLKGKNFYIDDNGTLSSNQVVARARKIAQKLGGKIDLVVVDYLQLLSDKGEGVQRITDISRALKLAARELDCPVVALSQLNRGLENRQNKRPILADLRESGAIEQDADTVIMIYRDELHDDNSQQKGIAEAIIRKNREGEPGTAYLAANLQFCRFDNLDTQFIPKREVTTKRSAFAHLDD
jgi:replicative DNA helicase